MEQVNMFNIRYYISKEDLNELKKNSKTLYICTHDYNPYDIFATFSISNKCKDHKFHHITSASLSAATTAYSSATSLALPAASSDSFFLSAASFFFLASALSRAGTNVSTKLCKKITDLVSNNAVILINKNKNTVKKAVDQLNNNNNVFIYLFRESTGTGIFKIKEQTNCKIVFFKITALSKIKYIEFEKLKFSFLGGLFLGGPRPKFQVKLQNIDKLPDNIRDLKQMLYKI